MVLAFWNTVDDCLVEFYSLGREKARKTTRDYRLRLAGLYTEKPDPYPDMIYHAKPIHIAGDLMGKDVRYDREQYALIEERNIRLSRQRNPAIAAQLASLAEELPSPTRHRMRRRPAKSELLPVIYDERKVLTSA